MGLLKVILVLIAIFLVLFVFRVIRRRLTFALILALALPGPVRAAGKSAAPDRQKLPIGSWECVRGACPDEEIQFSVEDGKQLYASWIHQHPGVTGTWSLAGAVVTIRTEGSSDEYEIVSVSRKALVLREKPGGETTRLRRVP